MMAAGRHQGLRRRLPVFLFVLSLGAGAGFTAVLPATAQSSSSELDAARAERDRLQADLDRALEGVGVERDEMADIRAQLEAARDQLRIVEGQLALAKEALASAELRIEVSEQELAIANRQLTEAEQELALEQEAFTRQIVEAYKFGGAARGQMVVTMLQNSESPGDLSRNLYRMGAVIDQQDRVIDRVAQLRDEHRAAADAATAAQAAAEASRQAAEVELAFVADQEAAATDLQAQVAAQEASQRSVLDRAAGDANAIAVRLAAAEARVKQAEADLRRVQAAARGGVLCPINPVWFSNDWGYPRSGGRTHQGTDMFADEGTPIVAIANGTIRRLDHDNTYAPGSNRGDLGGISVSYWVDGSEYWYFAHLQSIADGLREGMGIEAGQVIGFVGRTGNAWNTPPHAHVGRYVNGKAVNPYPTLQPACG